jgi:hypothetical protein
MLLHQHGRARASDARAGPRPGPRHRPAPRPACVAAPVGAGVLQALGAWQRSERPPWLLEPLKLLACAVATCRRTMVPSPRY